MFEANPKSVSAKRKIWPFLSESQAVIYPLHELPRAPRPFLISTPPKNRSKPEKQKYEIFHIAIGPILAVARVFGLLPLKGLRNNDPQKLSFNIISVMTFWTIIITICLLGVTVTSIIHTIRTLNTDSFDVRGTRGIAAATAGTVFYGNSLLATVMFLWLAPRWVILQKHWRAMELQLDSTTQHIDKHTCLRLGWKFRLITIAVMIPALLEHVISIVNNMPSSHFVTNGINATWKDYLELYTYKSHAFILSSYNYSIGLGIFLFMLSKIATFSWNFTDLFIMLVSTGLAERYKHLNTNLQKFAEMNFSTLNWREFRTNYATISSLVKKTDEIMSPMILQSFINNLYFVCLQLLNGLAPMDPSIFANIYFFGSFAFLIGRTVAVTLLAARINDQSRLALPTLYNCPSLDYNIEAQRLQLQLTTDEVALTGLRFFSITRNFMLAVAGAIVTYEVVLLQFNVAMKK